MISVAEWTEISEKCTGCAACVQCCPKGAVVMEMRSNGYWYPTVKPELCNRCGKCLSVCQDRKKEEERYINAETYAAWTKDKAIRFMSTSGGGFTEIARLIIEDRGIVVGAAYDGIEVLHKECTTLAGLEELRQSKYVQSKIGDIYSSISDYLCHGGQVLFAGTPCQVAGLYAYLGKNIEGLLTVGFICRGVCSPVAFRKWIEEYEEKSSSKIKRIWFKYKNDGWKASPRNINLEFMNGEIINVSGMDNLYMSAYLDTNCIIRPCCETCDFKGVMHLEDITLGDYWGVDEKYDDDGGTSVIIINSKVGLKYMNKLIESKRMEIYKCEYDDVARGNPMLLSSVVRNQKSDRFIELLVNNSYSDAYKLWRESL